MKLKYICPYCIPEHQLHISLYDCQGSFEMNNDYGYEFVCKNGHKNSVFISTPRYELLYDFGISAYIDGYYREAVLDFAACLERFHEYCIFKLLNHSINIENKIAFWNQIKKQSERQYGAFLTLYCHINGTLPKLQTNKYITFRNDITHKGYIPNKEETEEYAKYVADYIFEINKKLPEDHESWFASMFPIMSELQKKKFEGGGHNIITMLNMINNNMSFEDALENFEKYFDMFYEK